LAAKSTGPNVTWSDPISSVNDNTPAWVDDDLDDVMKHFDDYTYSGVLSDDELTSQHAIADSLDIGTGSTDVPPSQVV
jgi:hypothetical protein